MDIQQATEEKLERAMQMGAQWVLPFLRILYKKFTY